MPTQITQYRKALATPCHSANVRFLAGMRVAMRHEGGWPREALVTVWALVTAFWGGREARGGG